MPIIFGMEQGMVVYGRLQLFANFSSILSDPIDTNFIDTEPKRCGRSGAVLGPL
jgi:hypothetical protein